ncbi:MAG: enoyl-CoA hydratase-related protein [Pseudomonadota bacterium]
MSLAPDPIVFDVSPEGVAVVLLDRPAKHNAFDELMIAALADTFETLKGADHVRIVFIKGAGASFCAGADIDWMRRQGERTQEDNEADALAMARMFSHLHNLPQFTVSLIDGACMGGGLGLAAASDWVVATRTAHFRFSETRLGLTPATISPFVIEAIGPRRARALFASAMPFDAEAALRYGLADEIVDDGEGLESAMARLANFASETAPGAVADAKSLVRAVAGREIDDRLARETAKRIAARRASEEGREGLAAFLEKRAPEWKK